MLGIIGIKVILGISDLIICSSIALVMPNSGFTKFTKEEHRFTHQDFGAFNISRYFGLFGLEVELYE